MQPAFAPKAMLHGGVWQQARCGGAAAAYPKRKARTADRTVRLHKFADAIDKKKDQLARLITRDQGNAKACTSFSRTKLMAIGL